MIGTTGMGVQVKMRLMVVVRMHMHMEALLPESPRDRRTESDEHQANTGLKHPAPLTRNLEAEHQNGGASQEEHGGMSETPTKTDDARAKERPILNSDGGDCRDVIDIEGMLGPEKKTDGQNRNRV